MTDSILPFPKHHIYLELFGGSAAVLFSKIPSRIEVYNDINSQLVSFWKVLRDHYIYLKLRGELDIDARQLFNEYSFPTESEVENAYRFFYRNAMSFSGLFSTYAGINKKNPTSISAFHNKIENIKKFHDRIKNVKFENMHYKDLLERFLKNFDLETTLIYADPPYYHGGFAYESHTGSGYEWSENDFDELREMLTSFERAKIVVSIDKSDYLKGWHVQEVVRTNKASPKDNAGKRIEYIFRNFDPEKTEKMKKSFGLLRYG